MSWLQRLLGLGPSAPPQPEPTPPPIVTEEDRKAAELIGRVREIPLTKWSVLEYWDEMSGAVMCSGVIYGTRTDRGLPVELRVSTGSVNLRIDGFRVAGALPGRHSPNSVALMALKDVVETYFRDADHRTKDSLLDRI